ncbi:MAG: sulfotransferase [Bacteroidota bacterium]
MKKYFKRVYRVQLIYYRIASLCSPLLSLFENRWKVSDEHSNTPIFILGVPRSGSTYTYQLVTSVFNVNYIDNLIDVFHKNIRFAFKLSKWVYKGKRHQVFKSEFGNTMSYSWHAPSECGPFWYQYFPRSSYYISPDNIKEVDLEAFSSDIHWLSNKFSEPTVFKNLMVSGRIYALHKACPNAKFLFIKRDPFFNAQSIIQARRKLGIPENEWWSAKPYNYEELKSLPLIEKIAKQVFYLEKQIEDDLEKFFSEQFEIIHYEDYKQGLSKNLCKISNFMGLAKKEVNLTFEKQDRVNLPEAEAKLLKEEIEKLPWNE